MPKKQKEKELTLRISLDEYEALREQAKVNDKVITDPDIIATIDDDNIPYDSWGQEIYVGSSVTRRMLSSVWSVTLLRIPFSLERVERIA